MAQVQSLMRHLVDDDDGETDGGNDFLTKESANTGEAENGLAAATEGAPDNSNRGKRTRR
jgi:hypothetical protein